MILFVPSQADVLGLWRSPQGVSQLLSSLSALGVKFEEVKLDFQLSWSPKAACYSQEIGTSVMGHGWNGHGRNGTG